jgi:hypothetical protein
MFGDISKINNNLDLIYITASVILVDLIVIFIAKKYKSLGNQINIWYKKLGMTAVLLDVTIIIIGFIITRYIFHVSNIQFNPIYFILILLFVQLVHDLLLYKLIIEPAKYGNNTIIDIYKDYALENSYYILIADSLMVLFSAIIAMNLKNIDMHATISILILSIYMIPYLIYNK